MNTDELDSIRDTLFSAMDEQLAADTAAAEETQKIGQQQIMYNNDARGTLYSGQPTWERAQLAAEGASNLTELTSDDLAKRLDIWDNITDITDQINSYNKAAAAMAQAAVNASSGNSNTSSSYQSFLDLYNQLSGGSE